RPTESGSARASYRLRFPPTSSTSAGRRSGGFHPLPIFGTGRQTGGEEKAGGVGRLTKQSPFDRKLLNRSR
ncbi:MAG: hypothetical protein WCT34_05040, partial [Patescibacteria group bacterium]